MKKLGQALGALGGYGPVLLVLSLVAGALSPILSHAGYVLLPLSAFLLTLGSFLTAGLSPAEKGVRLSVIVVVLLWVGVGIPISAAAIVSMIPIDVALRAGALLALLAPPVGSAAAIAAMLGMQPRLALIASIVLTVAAPLTMPLLAGLFGLGVAMNTATLATRLFVIIGLAAVAAFAALHYRAALKPVLPDGRAATGIAVIGLVIVGLATSQGVRTQWLADPAAFERMLAAAVGLNFGVCAVGTLAFLWLGPRAAATVGLVSGNRNVTLAWAASSLALPPQAEGYLAACVVPVLALPLIIKMSCLLLSYRRRRLSAVH